MVKTLDIGNSQSRAVAEVSCNQVESETSSAPVSGQSAARKMLSHHPFVAPALATLVHLSLAEHG
ncbi:Uncharacterised protein [Vibrio cholerae]|nr:Uncharacterised protein [Vibrio cholerae]